MRTDYPRFGCRSRSGKEKQGETDHDTLWLGLPKGRNIAEVFGAHWSPPSMQVILNVFEQGWSPLMSKSKTWSASCGHHPGLSAARGDLRRLKIFTIVARVDRDSN
jgi:hypothetical protein